MMTNLEYIEKLIEVQFNLVWKIRKGVLRKLKVNIICCHCFTKSEIFVLPRLKPYFLIFFGITLYWGISTKKVTIKCVISDYFDLVFILINNYLQNSKFNLHDKVFKIFRKSNRTLIFTLTIYAFLYKIF